MNPGGWGATRMPRAARDGGSHNRLDELALGVVEDVPRREAKRAPCEMQRRPPTCNVPRGYFLAAIARFIAAAKRRFTSPQLMFRMKASM
jgi:hypothetical protein